MFALVARLKPDRKLSAAGGYRRNKIEIPRDFPNCNFSRTFDRDDADGTTPAVCTYIIRTIRLVFALANRVKRVDRNRRVFVRGRRAFSSWTHELYDRA